LAEAYSREEVKEFVIQRLHLTPETLGKAKNDKVAKILQMNKPQLM